MGPLSGPEVPKVSLGRLQKFGPFTPAAARLRAAVSLDGLGRISRHVRKSAKCDISLSGHAVKTSLALFPDPAEPRGSLVVVCCGHTEETFMNSIIYLVGLVVVVGAILAFLGLR